MKARTVLGTAIGTVGAAVVGNRLLTKRAGDLENPLPGIERTYRWRGIETTYTVAGDPQDPEVLLCHGIYTGASSHEFEPIFERLAEDYRVIAVDLPGFGRSERPPLVYSPTLYAEFLRDFTVAVTDEPIVVASSLAGSFAVDAADETEFEHLVLICPIEETAAERPWLRTLLRSPVVGTTLFNVLATKPAIRHFYSRDGYYDAGRLDEKELDYAWDSAHQPGARYAPASFASGTLDPAFDLTAALAALETPTTLVWGRDAELVPLRTGRNLAEAADLELVVVDYSTLLPHAEHPETFLEYLTAELLHADAGIDES
ncbi:alpha/beta fold hydrolase [Natronobacterium gregoryi]|uniref:Alpha/beta hydrolase n=2 Tax=Natronobacterium gregoryi TaxID=44930 RepID=L0ADZ1_NATGS|nr:alpha/beta hydrolase [Natronobacterium gregoryi]AFZ72066.1 putative hydrolase or acyltransferase of alpha/beta superfamily [Natronobacterium gregoryi SP2]ELY62761.1 alpha/beta hydrolase [Natronobacterium gregoryi SP2]PLK20040.1 alpha/beta hydrolase [Natronobacterium gregoryi SP2]SFJ44601.1 Pimeloyl-ACP methyl ester carboxylesterase [Natronobacterium gregoryi]